MNIESMTKQDCLDRMGSETTEAEAMALLSILALQDHWKDTSEISESDWQALIAQAIETAEEQENTPGAEELARRLSQAFDTADPDQFAELVEHYASSSTFAETGVLTNDAGFVLRMHDGSEFQITIIKSR